MNEMWDGSNSCITCGLHSIQFRNVTTIFRGKNTLISREARAECISKPGAYKISEINFLLRKKSRRESFGEL